MEFLDEDTRPRFLFHSRPLPSSLTNSQTQQKPLNKLLIVFSISVSILLLLSSILFFENEPFRSLFLWFSFSLFLGPFAPSNLTAGDIRVGHGPILEPIDQEPATVNEKQVRNKKRSKPVRSEEIAVNPIETSEMRSGLVRKEERIETLGRSENGLVRNEWSDQDLELLKKQIVKNPVGKPRRWEVIAEAFNGRYRVESVILKAKEMGEKKLDDSDSYSRFLKNRKPLDSRVQSEIQGADSGEKEGNDNGGGNGVEWSSAEDIALLNGLKAFPKDVEMRWEKIAAAVPGKSKAACMKRVAELKRNFRSSKAGAEC